MFRRCVGEFMNACWIWATSCPAPTFSPTVDQPPTSEPRLGLWYTSERAAWRSACPCATDARSPATAYAGNPAPLRAALVADTNAFESPLPARACGATNTKNAMLTARMVAADVNEILRIRSPSMYLCIGPFDGDVDRPSGSFS